MRVPSLGPDGHAAGRRRPCRLNASTEPRTVRAHFPNLPVEGLDWVELAPAGFSARSPPDRLRLAPFTAALPSGLAVGDLR